MPKLVYLINLFQFIYFSGSEKTILFDQIEPEKRRASNWERKFWLYECHIRGQCKFYEKNGECKDVPL